MPKARILVVEDEPVVATDLSCELKELGYEVAGVVADADAALASVSEENPDLVLMDIHLDGSRDGIEAATEIRREFGTPVVYLTAFADEATLQRAKDTEPYSYLVKPYSSDELNAALTIALHRHDQEEVRGREARVTLDKLDEIDAILHRLDDRQTQGDMPPPPVATLPYRSTVGLDLLSKREMDVLDQLVVGASVTKIAQHLHISRHTVRNHLKTMFQKVGVHSQVELIIKFRDEAK